MKILAALALVVTTACSTASPDDLALDPSMTGKADDASRPMIQLYQGHDREIRIDCEFPDRDAACAITFTLTPPPKDVEDTRSLIAKKLKGKQASDLPLPMVRFAYAGDSAINAVANLTTVAGAAKTAPVANLDDGTPVYFDGDLEITQAAHTSATLKLRMDPAFWYNLVSFDYAAAFRPLAE